MPKSRLTSAVRPAQRGGHLITLEGGEGAGKSTLAQWLEARAQAEGYEAIFLREPGGTIISEQIREVVLSAKNEGIANETEVLLFQAARAQIYAQLVLPALAAGQTVIMDRSRDSSVVYQGLVRGFGRDLIEGLNEFSTQATVPNLTLLLDVAVELGLARCRAVGENNRLDVESVAFHERVRVAYLELARENQGGRWQIIDAAQPLAMVQEAVWALVAPRLSSAKR